VADERTPDEEANGRLVAPPARWVVRPTNGTPPEALAADLGCSALLARLLIVRGIADTAQARRFLSPSFDDLPDPGGLPDAGPAIQRLRRAIDLGEFIWVHGDYDVDGVTSAALYGRLLRKLGARAHVHVPHRARDGYDLRTPFLNRAREAGARLILTADCGTRRIEEIAAAHRCGIDVIVTDHHEPGDALPHASAVVNPRRRGAPPEFGDLSGAGVAFRLGEALVAAAGLSVASYRRAYADLAAVGTVADVMPLLGQNRVIVHRGIELLRRTRKVGLRALLNVAGLREGAVTARDIAFGIGPRVNAIGRMHDAADALELLLTDDAATGDRLAGDLDRANAARQREQERVLSEAMESLVRQPADACFLVLHGQEWHPGVIGIVASKIVEITGRPSILISVDPGTGVGRGSGRSIPVFHLHRALTECSDLLVEYGGHALAAGLTIEASRIPEFAERMRTVAATALSEEDLVPVLEADAEVEPANLTSDDVLELARLEPCGSGNPEPRFVARGQLVRETRRIGQDGRHLRLVLEGPRRKTYHAIWWRHGERADLLQPGGEVDIYYRPLLDQYNGGIAVSAVLEDLRPSTTEAEGSPPPDTIAAAAGSLG